MPRTASRWQLKKSWFLESKETGTPPTNFFVRAVLRPPVWDCSCLVTVPTDELKRKGLWIGPHDDASIQPQPGEILFRIRPTALWVRVFWPLLVDRPF